MLAAEPPVLPDLDGLSEDLLDYADHFLWGGVGEEDAEFDLTEQVAAMGAEVSLDVVM